MFFEKINEIIEYLQDIEKKKDINIFPKYKTWLEFSGIEATPIFWITVSILITLAVGAFSFFLF
jgi:hypothetical protein